MSPIAKMAKFMFDASITIVVLLCVIWGMIAIRLFMVYGLFESLTFVLGSILLSILVCKRDHSHHKYDRKYDCDTGDTYPSGGLPL